MNDEFPTLPDGEILVHEDSNIGYRSETSSTSRVCER